MTDLLSRSSRETRRSQPAPATAATLSGSPAARATAAGLLAPVIGLFLVWVVTLTGWYSSDGGGHGTTRDALRVGTDAWLLAHGSHLALGQVDVAALPLGLTLLCGWLAYRSGRWAGATSTLEDLRSVGLATVILSGVYAVAAMVAAFVASAPGVGPNPVRAFCGALALAGVAGGWGLLSGARLSDRVPTWFPLTARAAAYGGVLTALGTVATAFVLLLTSLSMHAGAAGRILGQVGGGASGASFAVLVALLLVPNAALLTAAYLVGPGFALGAGTVVSTSAVSLGPVPASPLLAALPADGSPPQWLTAVLAVPVAVAALACWRAGRRLPTASYQTAAVRGVAAAVAGAVLLTVMVRLAGGAVGGGRMSDVGAPSWPVLVRALAAFTSGGVLGALGATWWTRRRDVPEAEAPQRPEIGPALAAARESVRDAGRAWTRTQAPEHALEDRPDDHELTVPVDLRPGG